MPSNHLILCCPLLLLPSIFSSIKVFSNELVLHIRWPKYWSFSFSISPSNEYSGLISFRMDWVDLLAVQGTLKSLPNTTVQKHQFFGSGGRVWASSSCDKWGLLFTVLCWLLVVVASLAMEHRPQSAQVSVVAACGLSGVGSVVVAQTLSCSEARGIFLDQGLNLCLLLWQVNS